MFDWMKKKLEQLLDSLVDPLWQKVLALSWFGRLAILVLSVAIFATVLHWKDAHRYVAIGAKIFIVTLHGDHGGIPLSNSYLERVKESISRLTISLEADLANRIVSGNMAEPGAWTPAQVVVALNGITPSDSHQSIVTFFRNRQDPACFCWREFMQQESPRHILASAWVLLALAQLNAPILPDEVRFMLNMQSGEGWWPMYPSLGRQDYASTYTTSHSLLALNEILRQNLITSPELIKAVTNAIRKGSGWLVSTRSPSQARWWDYPYSGNREISEGISGLVIHTLHRLGKTGYIELDRLWLEELPSTLPMVGDCGLYPVWATTLDGDQVDISCKLPLVWLLAGTVDSYRNGTVYQKAKTIVWVETVLDKTNILNSETISTVWKRAEILISLKHLLANII